MNEGDQREERLRLGGGLAAVGSDGGQRMLGLPVLCVRIDLTLLW